MQTSIVIVDITHALDAHPLNLDLKLPIYFIIQANPVKSCQMCTQITKNESKKIEQGMH